MALGSLKSFFHIPNPLINLVWTYLAIELRNKFV